MAACDCLVELTLDSKKVRLGDLGTFYMSAETKGTYREEDFTADNIKAVHLRFLPNQKRSYPLDSKTLRKQASLIAIDQLGDVTPKSSSSSGSGSGNGNSDVPVVERP